MHTSIRHVCPCRTTSREGTHTHPAPSAFALPPPQAELPGTTYQPPPTQAQDPTPQEFGRNVTEALRIAKERLADPGCRAVLNSVGQWDALSVLQTMIDRGRIYDTQTPNFGANGDPVLAEGTIGLGPDGRIDLYLGFHTEADDDERLSPDEYRAEVILHELWHVLGLRHGADEHASDVMDLNIYRSCFPQVPLPGDVAGTPRSGDPAVIYDDPVIVDGGSRPLPDSGDPTGYDTDVTIRDDQGNEVDGGATYDPNTDEDDDPSGGGGGSGYVDYEDDESFPEQADDEA